MIQRPFAFAALFAALAVSACSDMNPFAEKAVAPPCPRVRILGEASEITKFRDGPGRDLVDVVYGGRLVDVAGACQHDFDADTKRGTLTVELAPVLAAERGPADRERTAEFEYFVALLNDTEKVLSKNTFNLKIRFDGNVTRTRAADDPVTLEVPLREGQTGRQFEILLGFQLTEEELRYNRKNGAGTTR